MRFFSFLWNRRGIGKDVFLFTNIDAANEHQDRMKSQENCDWRKYQPNQGICYRDIASINLVNCKRIKKGLIQTIQLNMWQLNSINESNIIKELINESNATANTKYIYKIKTKVSLLETR